MNPSRLWNKNVPFSKLIPIILSSAHIFTLKLALDDNLSYILAFKIEPRTLKPPSPLRGSIGPAKRGSGAQLRLGNPARAGQAPAARQSRRGGTSACAEMLGGAGESFPRSFAFSIILNAKWYNVIAAEVHRHQLRKPFARGSGVLEAMPRLPDAPKLTGMG